jgi:Zn-dependent protease
VRGDPYDPSRGPALLRALSASFRLGRPLGVELRVYVLALVLVPLLVVLQARGWPFVERLALAAIVTFLLYLVVWSHEMGHVAAGRRYRVATPRITLSPLGGLAHMASQPPGPRAEATIALAGPAVHLLWLALAWPLTRVVAYGDGRPSGWLLDPLWAGSDVLFQMNLRLLAFNLLPFFPMDGGRVLRAALAARMHGNRATRIAAQVGLVGAVGFAVVGLFFSGLEGGILLAIGITNFFACRQELVAARWTPGPYAHADPRQPWEADADAWKAGSADRTARPGPLARWRAGRREARARREAELGRVAAEELDRVLERVGEVGLAGLTAKERAVLDRASRERRGR